jgi:hypothetical protein
MMTRHISIVAVILVVLMQITACSNRNKLCFFGQYFDPDHIPLIHLSFEQYRKDLRNQMEVVQSILTNMDQFDNTTRLLLDIHNDMRIFFRDIPPLWSINEILIQQLVDTHAPYIYPISNSICRSYVASDSSKPKISSYTSFHQLLIHLNRDWGNGGSEVRLLLYQEGIIGVLKNIINLKKSSSVLIPGAGLGRLAAMIASEGYRSHPSPS